MRATARPGRQRGVRPPLQERRPSGPPGRRAERLLPPPQQLRTAWPPAAATAAVRRALTPPRCSWRGTGKAMECRLWRCNPILSRVCLDSLYRAWPASSSAASFSSAATQIPLDAHQLSLSELIAVRVYQGQGINSNRGGLASTSAPAKGDAAPAAPEGSEHGGRWRGVLIRAATRPGWACRRCTTPCCPAASSPASAWPWARKTPAPGSPGRCAFMSSYPIGTHPGMRVKYLVCVRPSWLLTFAQSRQEQWSALKGWTDELPDLPNKRKIQLGVIRPGCTCVCKRPCRLHLGVTLCVPNTVTCPTCTESEIPCVRCSRSGRGGSAAPAALHGGQRADAKHGGGAGRGHRALPPTCRPPRSTGATWASSPRAPG